MEQRRSNRSLSFVVKMRILRKITFVFKDQSHYSGIRGQKVNPVLSKLNYETVEITQK